MSDKEYQNTIILPMEGHLPSIGPLTYRDGMTMTWQGGRELTGLSKGGVTTAYQYNETSIRTKKTVGASTTEYYLNGNTLINTHLPTIKVIL